MPCCLLGHLDHLCWGEDSCPPDKANVGESTASVDPDGSAADGGVNVKTIRIFLASSSELREDRDEF
jgi:hypothetical protein